MADEGARIEGEALQLADGDREFAVAAVRRERRVGERC